MIVFSIQQVIAYSESHSTHGTHCMHIIYSIYMCLHTVAQHELYSLWWNMYVLYHLYDTIGTYCMHTVWYIYHIQSCKHTDTIINQGINKSYLRTCTYLWTRIHWRWKFSGLCVLMKGTLVHMQVQRSIWKPGRQQTLSLFGATHTFPVCSQSLVPLVNHLRGVDIPFLMPFPKIKAK